MEQLVSPKQAARALGVSESSLKRWCDQGLIKMHRTAGGHRKLPIADVLRFVREHNHALGSPEILGLPPVSELAEAGLSRGAPRLVEALLSGDELLARQIVFDLYLARHPLSVIFDEVIAAAFREIGERWACHAADVYQERRGCEITHRILGDLRRVQDVPATPWLAIGGTIDGDQYSLPAAMAELVLRDAGYQATLLGTSIPFESLKTAVRDIRPKLCWLSVSHIPEGMDFIAEFASLSQCCTETGAALVVGGRALSEALRLRMTYSAYCDTMQHLEGFARVLHRSSAAVRDDRAGPQTASKTRKRRPE